MEFSKGLKCIRLKTLDIKTHQTYKYQDTLCRWCNLHDKSLAHIINCGEDAIEITDLDNIEDIDTEAALKISRMAYRIQEFLEKVDY